MWSYKDAAPAVTRRNQESADTVSLVCNRFAGTSIYTAVVATARADCSKWITFEIKTGDIAWSDAHLRASMSLGVNMSLVTAGLGSSEKVARCISCMARMV